MVRPVRAGGNPDRDCRQAQRRVRARDAKRRGEGQDAAAGRVRYREHTGTAGRDGGPRHCAPRQGRSGFRGKSAVAGDRMSLEYAPRGLVGVLTPQANTTVEPELNLLWPPGVAMINARLVSDKNSMSARLID